MGANGSDTERVGSVGMPALIVVGLAMVVLSVVVGLAMVVLSVAIDLPKSLRFDFTPGSVFVRSLF